MHPSYAHAICKITYILQHMQPADIFTFNNSQYVQHTDKTYNFQDIHCNTFPVIKSNSNQLKILSIIISRKCSGTGKK